MFKTIDWQIAGNIGYLVLNQPPANTMTGEFFDELGILTRDVIPGSSIRALVIYGQGRHFSAGADHIELKGMIRENLSVDSPDEVPGFLKENADSFRYIEQLNIPSFAAIRGVCLGSALELALCCKFRVCSEGTVLGLPESSFGLMPGCGGSVKLPAITGRAIAMELILTGRNFSAEEAYQWGLVHKIVARKKLVEETVEIAEKMITDC